MHKHTVPAAGRTGNRERRTARKALITAHRAAVRECQNGLDAHRLRRADQVALRAEIARICR
jgi:hypothetical protein